eukprot:scaffold93626_cov25-Tisochrysis_lutea.AAC.1
MRIAYDKSGSFRWTGIHVNPLGRCEGAHSAHQTCRAPGVGATHPSVSCDYRLRCFVSKSGIILQPLNSDCQQVAPLKNPKYY